MPDEMTAAEDAAFAAMANEQAAPAPAEPEEPEAAAPPSESEADEPAEGAESGESEGEGQAKPAERRQFVPHEAFHEERTRRQQLEAENRRLSEERARFDERLRVIQEMNQPAPPAEPDETVDPIGTITHLRERLARLEQSGQQSSAEQQRRAQEASLARAAAQDATAFRAQTPDYAEAYQFWGQSRANELLAYGVPAQDIPAVLESEQLQLAASAYQRGVSPAETLYRVAHQRGYKGVAARTNPRGLSEGNGADNGHAAAEQIQRVATGQQRSPSLSGTGGGAAPTAMTVPQLLAMSKEEFAEWTEKNPRKTARLMGEEPPPRRRA